MNRKCTTLIITLLIAFCLVLPCESQKRGKGVSLGLVDTSKPSKFGPGLFVVLILMLMFSAYAYDTVPPITIAIICVLLAFHSRFFTELDLPNTTICMDAKLVTSKKQYYRLITSTFYHSNDLHLVINLVSFIGKASSLEQCFGSDHFLVIFFMVAITVNLISLPVANAASFYLGSKMINKCIVGISGINFAMQTITSTMYGNRAIASWIELPIMSFLLPKTTLVLNFSGVFAGFLVMLILDYISRTHSESSKTRCCGRPSCNGNGGNGGPCAKASVKLKAANEHGCRSTTPCKTTCKSASKVNPCRKCGHTGCQGGCGTGYGGFGGGQTLSRKHWFWTGVHGY